MTERQVFALGHISPDWQPGDRLDGDMPGCVLDELVARGQAGYEPPAVNVPGTPGSCAHPTPHAEAMARLAGAGRIGGV